MKAGALARLADRWNQTLIEHQGVNGRCPRCRTAARCWEWAEAFGQLVAHDFMVLRPAGEGSR